MPHTAEAIRLFRAHITESLLSRPDVGNLLLPRRVMLSCYDGATESDPAGMYAAHRDGFAPPTWQDGLEYAAESNSTRNPPLLAISGSYSDRLLVCAVGRTTMAEGVGAGAHFQHFLLSSLRVSLKQDAN